MVRATSVAALVLPLALGAATADATPKVDPARWHDVKCERYGRAWKQALARQGPPGLSQHFLDSHAAFLASNCTRRADVCARSPEELKLANTMVALSMNFGAASTLAPFYCR